MRTLWLHLRNSPIRWALPVLIALDLAVLLVRNRHWVGVWPESGAAAQTPAIFLGAVGAGAAAWAAAAPVRHNLRDQLAGARVHRVIPEAYRLAATVIIVLLPYLVGQAVAFAATARTFPPGWQLWLGYLVLGMVAVLLAVAWGWFLGRLLGSRFAALFAMLGWLFFVAMVDPVLGSTVVVGGGPPELAVEPAAMAVRLVLVLVLLATLPWLPTLDRLGEQAWQAAIPASAIAALGVVLLATTVVGQRDLPGDNVICVDGRSELCIWPEHEKYVPMLREMAARIDALPSAFHAPPRMNEFGIERTQFVDSDGVIQYSEEEHAPHFTLHEGSRWSYAGRIASAILGETWDAYGCDLLASWEEMPAADRNRLPTMEGWLEAYLAGGGSPDYTTNAPVEIRDAWSAGMEQANVTSQAEQFRWAKQEAGHIREHYC